MTLTPSPAEVAVGGAEGGGHDGRGGEVAADARDAMRKAALNSWTSLTSVKRGDGTTRLQQS